MKAGQFKYLKPEDILKLSNYEFAPKSIVEGYLNGRHQSHQRGLSTEFRDYRAYAPGDDPGTLDWKVYARTDRHYVRTFEEETNTSCYIVLDSSASMGFGEKITKLEYSSFFAAALCYLVVKTGNLVSLQLFDEKIREYRPLGSTNRHMRELMTLLENNAPGEKTRLSEALNRSFPLMKTRGTLIVVSDFFDDPSEIFKSLNQYLHKGFKVVLFHVLSPEDLKLDGDSLFQFVDMEDGRNVIAHSATIGDRYAGLIKDHLEAMRSLAVRRGIDYMMVDTNTHYFKMFDRLVR